MEKEKTYSAKGIVVGNLWGGGLGYYPARKYNNDDKEDMLKEIKEDFKSGGLDSGMGYNGLCGAIMEITTYSTVLIDGDHYTNESTGTMEIGEVTNEFINIFEDNYDCIY